MRTISLPDPLHDAAEELAARAGFASATEYIADLVRRDVEQVRQEADSHFRPLSDGTDSCPLTEAERERQRRGIEKLLIAGLDSGPATEMTAEHWEDLHRRVEARLARTDP